MRLRPMTMSSTPPAWRSRGRLSRSGLTAAVTAMPTTVNTPPNPTTNAMAAGRVPHVQAPGRLPAATPPEGDGIVSVDPGGPALASDRVAPSCPR